MRVTGVGWLVIMLACSGESPDGAGRVAATRADAVSADSARTDSAYRLLVVNPMPHAMVASLDQAGAMTELGTIPPGGRQVFELPAPPGATVTLIARDLAKTHSPTVTMNLPASDSYATWTIETIE